MFLANSASQLRIFRQILAMSCKGLKVNVAATVQQVMLGGWPCFCSSLVCLKITWSSTQADSISFQRSSLSRPFYLDTYNQNLFQKS